MVELWEFKKATKIFLNVFVSFISTDTSTKVKLRTLKFSCI